MATLCLVLNDDGRVGRTVYKMFCLVSLVSFVALVVAYNLIKGKYGTKISVQGKSVMITGCDSGVGLSMALFAQDVGFDVIATCLSISSTGAELLRSKNIFVIKMDVTRVEDVEDARQVVGSHLRKNNLSLWALINNAGVLVFGHFDWQVETQMLQQINVNLIGAMRVTKAFLPFLRHSRGTMKKSFIDYLYLVFCHCLSPTNITLEIYSFISD